MPPSPAQTPLFSEANLELALTRPALEEVRGVLAQRIAAGLARSGEEIRALPAYLPVPEERLSGRALVLDAGGTNLRAAVVELGAEPRILKGPVRSRIPDGRDGASVSRAAFFAAHAALARELAPEPGLPVGYCFSFPSEIQPDCDARLLAWTKGIRVDGVVGTLVGAGLGEALAAEGMRPGPVRVLNDTVASLLGGAANFRKDGFDGFIGLIAGTGTNMAAFFEQARIPKLDGAKAGVHMAINLESGNFTPPHLTRWDDAVDMGSVAPRTQRFEKAVSGYYLPFVFREIVGEHAGFDPAEGSRPLVEIRDGLRPAATGVRTIAQRLLDRSADLVAAALAAVIDAAGVKGKVGILAEGSLFWATPGFAHRVRSQLDQLVGPERTQVLRMEEANLVGSATAALAFVPR